MFYQIWTSIVIAYAATARCMRLKVYIVIMRKLLLETHDDVNMRLDRSVPVKAGASPKSLRYAKM
jgi:hypothetical protein